MNLLRMSNMTMMDNISSKLAAVHGADSCMTQSSYESGLVFSEGWPLNKGITGLRNEWELEFAGNVVQQDNSSSSEQTHALQGNARSGPASGMKRKATSRNGRTSMEPSKDSPSDEKNLAKCAKIGGTVRKGSPDESKAEHTTSDQTEDLSPRSKMIKELHPKQDFIHVRARRGQATDSHSLAERVRREKISERMKFLQDLVPGCSKITGKAVVLDEIINYVQSLQCQIEFLSMKLAAIDSRLDSNLENLLSKEIVQARFPETTLMGSDLLIGHPDYQSHVQIQQQINNCNMDLRNVGNLCDAYFRRSMNSPVPGHLAYTDHFVAESLTQTIGEVSDGDLQTIVQMGNSQGRLDFSGQAGLHGPGFFPTGHLKVEY